VSRLTRRLRGARRRVQTVTFIGGRARSPAERDGITVDGVHNQLGGQPPVATSRGWGQKPGWPN
jgi:hypothetical protein